MTGADAAGLADFCALLDFWAGGFASKSFWPVGVEIRMRRLVSKELWQVTLMREQFRHGFPPRHRTFLRRHVRHPVNLQLASAIPSFLQVLEGELTMESPF
jgi:hypothetical protein